MGISIKTQRAKGTSRQRAYSLIERSTGRVLYHDIDGLIDLEAVLSRIVWDRQLARADGPPASATSRSCPSCGTPRIGQFRFCRSCGRDFEPTAHTVARWPPFELPVPEATSEAKTGTKEPIEPVPIRPTDLQIERTRARIEPIEASAPPAGVSKPFPQPDYGPGPGRRRLPRLHIPRRDRDSFL